MNVELLTRAEVEQIRASVQRLLQNIGELEFCEQCWQSIVRVEDCRGSWVAYRTVGGKHVCSKAAIPLYLM